MVLTSLRLIVPLENWMFRIEMTENIHKPVEFWYTLSQNRQALTLAILRGDGYIDFTYTYEKTEFKNQLVFFFIFFIIVVSF